MPDSHSRENYLQRRICHLWSVDLAEIDLNTMESKKCNGVFFAGEVLNIDGETGGFNFQAAWSTAYLAAAAMWKG
jgi:predicted flavoprotein YhiN